MATNTSGGTTSSFMNTPQAVDDSYNVVEDYIYCFDVMSNDLGGNAKILWSIDDSTLDGTTGISGSGDGTYDLLSQDAACVPELSDLGAKIWIESGKIRYDARVFNYLAANQTVTDHFTYAIRLSNGTLSWATVTITITGTNDGPTVSAADLSGAVTEDGSDPSLTDTGTITFDDVDLTDTHTTSVTASAGNTLGGVLTASVTDPATGAGDGTVTWNYSVANSATQYLAQGQTATERFTIRIQDSNGGYIDQIVVVTITGTNDGPTVSAADLVGAATEDAASPNLTDTGTITFDDLDLIDTHSTTVTPALGNTLGGTLTASVTDAATGAGDGTVTWNYSVANSATQYLASGETASETFTIRISDNHGGYIDQVVVVTITGTNDKPDIRVESGDNALASINETDSGLSAGGALTVTDVDTLDTISTSIGLTNVTGPTGGLTNLQLLGMLSVAPSSGLAANTGDTNNLGWTFDSGSQAFDYLRAGQTLQLVYTLTVDDSNGGTDTQNVTITITGTNDAPVLGDTTDPSAVVELGDASAQNLDAISGSFSVTDLDVGDALDASVVGGVSVLLNGAPFVLPAGAAALTAVGAFTVTDTVSNGGAASVGYSYDPGAANLDFLAAGQTLTITYTVQVSDGTSTSGTQDVTFSITGTNDDPDIRVETGDSASDSLQETNAELTTSGTLTVTDVDTADQISTSIALTNVTGNQGSLSNAQLEAMLSVTPDSGLDADTGDANNLTWNFDSDGEAFNYLAPGQSLQLTYTLTVSDGNGGSDMETVTITVQGTNDAPVLTGDLTATIDEGGAYQLTTADVNFTDPDDIAADVTFTVSGLSNGTLYVNGITGNSFTGGQLADGLVTFTHDGSETTTAGFSISVEDGNEDLSAPVAQPFNFTVTPVNDAPANTLPGGQSVDEDQLLVFSSGNGNAISISDADAGSSTVQVTLSVASGTLTLGSVAGVSVTGGADGSSTVTIQGTQSNINAALQGLTYQGNLNFNGGDSLSIVTSDLGNTGSGGALSDSDSVAITVNAVNDAPVNNTPANFSTNEDNALKLSGLSVTDVDAGSGAITVTLSVASGTLTAANTGGVTVSGSGSGSITLTGTLAAINTYLGTVANQPTYTPVADANGAVTLTMTTNDGGNTGSGGALSDTDNVTINIAAVNDAPVATPVTLTAIAEDSGPRIITQAELLAGVSDIDGPSLSVTALSIATGSGSLISNGNGTWTYNPALDDDTSVTFNYTASDGFLTANSTATMDITPVDDRVAPTDITLTTTTPSGNFSFSSFQFSGTLSATDPDPGAFTFTITSQSDPGLFSISGNTLTSGNLGQNDQFTVIVRATQTGDPAGVFREETFGIITGSNGANTADSVSGLTGDDVLYGNGGNDMIFGMGGNDTLFGQNGNDTLYGGDGNDVLIGGDGSDNFVFDSTPNGITNHDIIQDFNASGIDKIVLENSIFTQLTTTGTLSANNFASNAGGNATDANDYILYDTLTGNLYYDADGNGAGARVLIATLTVTAGTIDPTDILIV